jgi:hypothetical protein
MNMAGVQTEIATAYSECYPRILLEDLRKTMKNGKFKAKLLTLNQHVSYFISV